MTDPDAPWVLRCRRGDTSAMEMLYRRHVERVWRYGWFVTRSRDAAAEIVQETFLRVLASIRGFQGRSTFATWLYAITRSVSSAYIRRQRREQRRREEGVLRLVPASPLRPGDAPDEVLLERMRGAIPELPGAQRDAILVCELLGLGLADGAAVLGWTETRLKSTLFRARRKLRERVTERGAGRTDEQRASHSGKKERFE